MSIDYNHVTSAHAHEALCIHLHKLSSHRKCGIVGLFPKFSYEIRHNLVESFRAKTNLIVVYETKS